MVRCSEMVNVSGRLTRGAVKMLVYDDKMLVGEGLGLLARCW